MDFNEIAIFAKVVQAGSFIGAARELGLPKSTVSRKVNQLEERLGARLLQRTTRTLSLTEVGRIYFQHAARLVAEAEDAELSVARLQEVPRGLLRVAAPLNFGFLGGIVASFLDRYRDVHIEMTCLDRLVHLVEEGYDVGIRAGRLADSGLIGRKLGVLRSYVVASPDFVERYGEAREPEDLLAYDCIAFVAGLGKPPWIMRQGKTERSIAIQPRFAVNDFEMLREVVLSGMAATVLPDLQCAAHVRSGRLQRLLSSWSLPEIPIHAIYPSSRHLSTKMKVFLDHLRHEMKSPPWSVDSETRLA